MVPCQRTPFRYLGQAVERCTALQTGPLSASPEATIAVIGQSVERMLVVRVLLRPVSALHSQFVRRRTELPATAPALPIRDSFQRARCGAVYRVLSPFLLLPSFDFCGGVERCVAPTVLLCCCWSCCVSAAVWDRKRHASRTMNSRTPASSCSLATATAERSAWSRSGSCENVRIATLAGSVTTAELVARRQPLSLFPARRSQKCPAFAAARAGACDSALRKGRV